MLPVWRPHLESLWSKAMKSVRFVRQYGERAGVLAEDEGGFTSQLSPLASYKFWEQLTLFKAWVLSTKSFNFLERKRKKRKKPVLVVFAALWTHHLLVCILKSGQRRVAFIDFSWYKSFNDQKNSLFLNYHDSLDPLLESCGYHLLWESMNFSPIQVLPTLTH